MGQYDSDKERLYHQSKLILLTLEAFIRQIEEYELTNEQFFIDFEDSINELSIKDHNVKPIES